MNSALNEKHSEGAEPSAEGLEWFRTQVSVSAYSSPRCVYTEVWGLPGPHLLT